MTWVLRHAAKHGPVALSVKKRRGEEDGEIAHQFMGFNGPNMTELVSLHPNIRRAKVGRYKPRINACLVLSGECGSPPRVMKTGGVITGTENSIPDSRRVATNIAKSRLKVLEPCLNQQHSLAL
jgi:hypothetical protein